MSESIKRIPCPNCRAQGKDRSGDNLIQFKDGGSHCFSCGYHEQPERSIATIKKDMERRTYTSGRHVSLPSDFSYNIPTEPLGWLYKYQLSTKEIKDNRIGWAPSEGLLIFPVYGGSENDLVMWQGRFFPEKKQKYYTAGDAKKVLHILRSSSNSGELAITEDIVSAIKVSRIVDAMPMWGGLLSPSLAVRLTSRYKRLIIWGDHDKRKDCIKMRNKYDLIFQEGCGMITSVLDPKEYQTEEIAEFVEYSRIGAKV